MFPTNINVEMMVRTAILAVEDYEFINFATNEWTLHGQDITNMILSKINMTPNTQSPEEVARESVNKIVEQMKYKFAKQKEAQQCFYNTSILHQLQPPRLYTEPQINLVQQYLEEVQRILMDISSKFNTVLGTVAIYEMIWHIMQMLSQMKNGLYARFYFQVWYDQSAHTIRVELHDPFDMIPEDKKVLGISVKTRDVPAPVEPPKPQEQPKEDDPFEDVPKDDDVSDNGVTSPVRTRRPTATVHKRNIQIMASMKTLHMIGNHAASATLLRGFLKVGEVCNHKLTNAFNKLQVQAYIKKVDDNHSWTTYRLTDKGEAAVTNTHVSLSWTTWFKNIFQNEDDRTMAISFFLNGANRQALTTVNRNAYMALLMSGLMVLVGDRLTRTEFGEKVYKLFNQEVDARHKQEGVHNAN